MILCTFKFIILGGSRVVVCQRLTTMIQSPVAVSMYNYVIALVHVIIFVCHVIPYLNFVLFIHLEETYNKINNCIPTELENIGSLDDIDGSEVFNTTDYTPRVIIPDPASTIPVPGQAAAWQIRVSEILEPRQFWIALQIWRPSKLDQTYGILVHESARYTTFSVDGTVGKILNIIISVQITLSVNCGYISPDVK